MEIIDVRAFNTKFLIIVGYCNIIPLDFCQHTSGAAPDKEFA